MNFSTQFSLFVHKRFVNNYQTLYVFYKYDKQIKSWKLKYKNSLLANIYIFY